MTFDNIYSNILYSKKTVTFIKFIPSNYPKATLIDL